MNPQREPPRPSADTTSTRLATRPWCLVLVSWPFGLDLLEQTLPGSVGRSQTVPFVDGLPRPEPFEQVTPLHCGPHPVQNAPGTTTEYASCVHPMGLGDGDPRRDRHGPHRQARRPVGTDPHRRRVRHDPGETAQAWRPTSGRRSRRPADWPWTVLSRSGTRASRCIPTPSTRCNCSGPSNAYIGPRDVLRTR